MSRSVLPPSVTTPRCCCPSKPGRCPPHVGGRSGICAPQPLLASSASRWTPCHKGCEDPGQRRPDNFADRQTRRPPPHHVPSTHRPAALPTAGSRARQQQQSRTPFSALSSEDGQRGGDLWRVNAAAPHHLAAAAVAASSGRGLCKEGAGLHHQRASINIPCTRPDYAATAVSGRRRGSQRSICREKTARKEGLMASLRVLLTPQLVTAAVDSLYLDRIRPLLVDVLQRVKHRVKQTFQGGDCGDSAPTTSSSTHSGDDDDSAASSSRIDIALKAVGALDVCILYVFIRSECRDRLALVLPSAPVPANAALALKAISSCDFRAAVLPLSVPALTSYIGQTEVQSLHPPPNCLPWVDPHEPHNPYSEVAWRSLGAFLTSRLAASTQRDVAHPNKGESLMPYQFKGGRYGLALELQKGDLPALRQMSLGELCHLVQLAITGRLLAYEHSVLQPVASCVDISGTLLRLDRNYDEEAGKNTGDPLNPTEWPLVGGDDMTTTADSAEIGSNGPAFNLSAKDVGRRRYDTFEELAADLDALLESKPEGLVTAQLKKALLARFGKDVLPQKFGYKKLTECLTQNPIIASVCQVVCLNPPSDCLLLVHRKYLPSVAPAAAAPDTLPSPASQSTAAGSSSDNLSATSLVACRTPESLQLTPSPPTQKRASGADIQIPDVTLTPAPALLGVTFNAWAAMRRLSSGSATGEDTHRGESRTSSDAGLQTAAATSSEEEEEDNEEVFEPVRRVLQAWAEDRLDNNPEYNNRLPSIYESYWDCFLPARRSGQPPPSLGVSY